MNNIFNITGELSTIYLKHYVPQVGSKMFDSILFNNKIKILTTDIVNEINIDYIIDDDYNLLLGIGHFKLNKKKNTLKMAGTLKLNNEGKIMYIDNNSGHYEPDNQKFNLFLTKISSLLSSKFQFKSIKF